MSFNPDDENEVGSQASGRNGGFMESSLTHGVANGQERFPDELPLLEELGLKNLNDIEAAIKRYNIDCDYERTGVIDIATEFHSPSYLDELRDDYTQLRSLGQKVEWLDKAAMQAQVNSPTYTGGLWRKDRAAIVDPARLAWGLKSAAMSLGVRIYEDTKATAIEKDGVGVLITTPLGRIRAGKVALATNAFKPLLKRISHYVAPVYDYCMVTEPLSNQQLADIGWKGRQGLSDISNQFHYYRLTEDNRILWGGYDVIYYWRARDVVEAVGPFLSDLPAARRHPLDPHVGRCDRHLQPVLRVLGQRHARQGGVLRRLHRSRRRIHPLRRGGDARHDRRQAQQGHEHRVREEQAAAVPTRAVPLHRHPNHPLVTRPRGQDRQAQPVAAWPRPLRPRLRQLTLGRVSGAAPRCCAARA